MRQRLSIRLVALALAGTVALPAAAQGASPAKSSTAACASAQTDVVAATIAKATSATLCLLNRERAARDLRPLKLDRRLNGAALAHSRDMVRKRYFEHNSLDGRTPFQRMLATRYVPKGASWTLGENIGWGTLSLAQPAAVVRAWMKSPGHRANILNPQFEEIGIGIAVGVPLDDPNLDGQTGATYTTDFGRHG
jgi:uncharacterized protein YkwD